MKWQKMKENNDNNSKMAKDYQKMAKKTMTHLRYTAS